MKECILSIFWPRKDIISFFANNSCPEDCIQHVRYFKQREFTRSYIVDYVFEWLSSKPGGSLGQFRAMLKSLITWSHFDSYYFDELRKLDRDKVIRNINHLKQLQEIRDAKIKETRAKRQEDERRRHENNQQTQILRDEFLALFSSSDSPQQRGYALEKILLELARLYKLDVTNPFKITGEQIDGSIKYEGEHYILETRWRDKASSTEPLYKFAHTVEGKMYGRGIFISINGFSEKVVLALIDGKAIKTILIDGSDLVIVLEGLITFTDMIESKVKAAQTKGLIYVDPITGKAKFH